MHAHYDIWLLMLSVAITGIAGLFTFDMVGHLYQATPNSRKTLLPSFSLIVGTGLWANHFLTTLAIHGTNELGYAPIMHLFGWFFAVITGFLILKLASKPYFNFPAFINGSIACSICIFALYFSCLSGMHSTDRITLIPEMIFPAILLSAFVAFMTSLLLFWAKGYVGKHPMIVKIIFAFLIAGLVSVTHLTLNNATIIDINLLDGSSETTKLAGFTIALSVLCLFLMAFLMMLFFERHGYKMFNFDLLEVKKGSAKSLHATVDSLTNLPNRLGLQDNLNNAISRSERSFKTIALAYIDLDHFKPINDNYGHHVGDIVLASAANRLSAAIRGCDSLARIGGDEFVAIIEGIKSNEDIIPIVERMVNSIREPFLIDRQKIEISCSVGIAIYPGDGDTEKLMVCADNAMYKAKKSGKNQYKFYDVEIESSIDQLLEMQNDLLIAIDKKEFSLAFQPKLCCKTQAIVGAEALIHWHHPSKGFIDPEYFIPTAEHLGLISQINDWMIEEACKTIYRAKDLDIDLNLAIDLSQQQFRNIHLVKETIKRFDNYGVPAQNLTVEIKETSVMNDVQFKRLLTQFKAANIKIALDDFGFHPFTLASLQDLKVDEIKLNKACISNIDKDNSSKNFAGAIIHLAQTLNFNVVADGVETESMRQILTDLGCNHMQGYLNTKPIAEAKLFNLLKKHDLDHQLKNQSSESTFQEVSS